MADLRVLVVDDEPEVAAGHAAYVRRVPGFELVGTAGRSRPQSPSSPAKRSTWCCST